MRSRYVQIESVVIQQGFSRRLYGALRRAALISGIVGGFGFLQRSLISRYKSTIVETSWPFQVHIVGMRDERGGEEQVHLWGSQTDRGAQRGTMDPWHGSPQHRFQRGITLEHQQLLSFPLMWD